MHFFRRLFGPSPAECKPFNAPLDPARRLYAVGDIHGCATLLEQLLDTITADAEDTAYDLIFVGDYIDRGDDSAAVLPRLQELSQAPHVTCLMGNHERMLLDFLDDPAGKGHLWLRNGGLQTLASFGVGHLSETSSAKAMTRARDELRTKLGQLEPWFRSLPIKWESGNICVVHAAVDPTVRIFDQTNETLLWGHPKFMHTPRQDGIWVIHGHSAVDHPVAEGGRIAIDTGAYFSGRLSVAVVEIGNVRFLRAGPAV